VVFGQNTKNAALNDEASARRARLAYISEDDNKNILQNI